MIKPEQSLVSHFEPPHANLRSYIIGYASCLAITLLAYIAATSQDISNRAAIVIIGGLAILQCIIQLRRFLHLGVEFKPRWKLAMFILMLIIGLIVVIGSLWIMSNLNYQMLHSPADVNEYVKEHDGL